MGLSPNQQLFSAKHIAQEAGLSVSTVWNLVKRGILAPPHHVPGTANSKRWFRLDVENFLERVRESPPDPPEKEKS